MTTYALQAAAVKMSIPTFKEQPEFAESKYVSYLLLKEVPKENIEVYGSLTKCLVLSICVGWLVDTTLK